MTAPRVLLRQTGTHEGAIFRNARRKTLSRDGAAYILARHASAAAEPLSGLRRSRVNPHVLRRSCAVALLQFGVDPTVIRDYLGHASIETTKRCVTSNLDMKRHAPKRIWIGSIKTAPAEASGSKRMQAVAESISLHAARAWT